MSGANPLDLSGKVILITGGAQGIGGATARLCAARGAAVVIADYDANAGQHTVDEINGSGGKATFVATDVRDPDQVKAAVDNAQKVYGRLDGLLCAAGILLGPWQQPEELSLDDFEKTIDVNVKGSFLCAKFATPLLEASGNGVIVLIASGAGVSGPSSSLAYGSSKGGVNGLGMTLQNHLKDRHIRVNVICPGNIVTQMKLSVDVAAAKRANTPVEDAYRHAELNYGSPAGMAKIIAFMLSDEADYLRGTLFTR